MRWLECDVCQIKLLISEVGQQVKIDNRLKKAITFNENGQLREAEILFKQILKNNPKHFGALYTLATIEQKIGTALKALEYIDRAIKVKLICADSNSMYALAWCFRGVVMQDLSRNREALECYDRAIKIDDRCNTALLHRGVLLGKMGQLQKTVDNYDSLLKINPNNTEALKNKGFITPHSNSMTKLFQPLKDCLKSIPNIFTRLDHIATSNS